MRPDIPALAVLVVLSGCARAKELPPRTSDADEAIGTADEREPEQRKPDQGSHGGDDDEPAPAPARDASAAGDSTDTAEALDAGSAVEADRPGVNCFTPRTVEEGVISASDTRGCSCKDANPNRIVCVNGRGFVCVGDRWLGGLDGACSAPGPDAAVDVAAALDAGRSCSSPTARTRAYELPGCDCEETIANITGFCVDSREFVCDDGKWQTAGKGLCLAPGTISEDACRARDGELLGISPQALHHVWRERALCPDGRQLLGGVTRVLVDDAGTESYAGQAPCCARP